MNIFKLTVIVHFVRTIVRNPNLTVIWTTNPRYPSQLNPQSTGTEFGAADINFFFCLPFPLHFLAVAASVAWWPLLAASASSGWPAPGGSVSSPRLESRGKQNKLFFLFSFMPHSIFQKKIIDLPIFFILQFLIFYNI